MTTRTAVRSGVRCRCRPPVCWPAAAAGSAPTGNAGGRALGRHRFEKVSPPGTQGHRPTDRPWRHGRRRSRPVPPHPPDPGWCWSARRAQPVATRCWPARHQPSPGRLSIRPSIAWPAPASAWSPVPKSWSCRPGHGFNGGQIIVRHSQFQPLFQVVGLLQQLQLEHREVVADLAQLHRRM
ncbi:hypothetical protein D3C71_740400 [compost metagenome]